MRWVRWGAGAAVLIWLMLMAQREARRRGRRGLAAALPLAGAGIFSFLWAIFSPAYSNLFLLLALFLFAGAMGLMLWKGFR